MSRAPPEQGARQRESAVYKGVHEHFELPRNAAVASAVVFKTASKADLLGTFPVAIKVFTASRQK